MKTLIRKIPGVAFGILIFLPLVLLFNMPSSMGVGTVKLLAAIVPAVVIGIWLLSLYDFLKDVLKFQNKPQTIVVTLIVIGDMLLWIYTNLRIGATPDPELNTYLHMGLQVLQLGVYIFLVVILAKHVKEYLYARSTWWIVVELLVPVIGVLTLTPTLQEEYKHRLQHGEPTEEEKLGIS